MKKLMLILFLGLLTQLSQSQTSNGIDEPNLSPNGLFEKVFDHYGNSYKLSDIVVGKEERDSNGNILRSTSLTPVTCGYFNLYFETGSGMEDSSIPEHLDRRAVVCQVFTDLSNFINSPLTTNGLNNKVNIWVRNIANITDVPSSVKGLASSFYTTPYNTTPNFGGIVDNEIWKTIHLGKDSYTNISLLFVNGSNSGHFYHGIMAFNFENFNFNTDLLTSSFPDQSDLYSIVLHEMMHSLGFASLLNSSGNSTLGLGYNYFTRYDTKLKNNINTEFLIKQNISSCGTMYNYSFNSTLNTSILHPSSTLCSDKIRFVGTDNVIAFTPPAFNSGSSLSHFDQNCVSPNPQFLMNSSIGTNEIKRYLKPQERNTLGDIGYNLKTFYGISTTYQGSTTYSGAIFGISVAGMNDGIDALTSSYTFMGNPGDPITINSFLNNDINATAFECLEDVFDSSSTISNSSGYATTTVTFTSNNEGLHLLRYVPLNSSGQKGNITYIFVYVNEINACPNTEISICNLVNNGDFESFLVDPATLTPTEVPSGFIGLDNACGWYNVNNGSPDYLHTNAINLPSSSSPCNYFGFEDDNISGNNAYAGMYLRKTGSSAQPVPYYENIRTVLNSPLSPNARYQLSFDISSADKFAVNAYGIQAYLSSSVVASSAYGSIPISNPNMLKTSDSFITQSSGWQKIVMNFTTDNIAGEKHLYIGGLKDPEYLSNANSVISSIAGCFSGNTINSSNTSAAYYYIDNVQLVPLNDIVFNLPEEICSNESVITDLSEFISNVNPTGIFSGNGVVSSATYSFDPSIAGEGIHTITYTFVNSNGCEVEIYDTINVLLESNPLCDCVNFLIFSSTETNTPIVYSTSDFIETNTNYLVNTDTDVTLKAGNYIAIKPNSQITNGSAFWARIENCDGTQSGRLKTVVPEKTDLLKNNRTYNFNDNYSLAKNINDSKNEEKSTIVDVDGLALYPNPVSGNVLNITSTANGDMSVQIFDILGKQVLTTSVVNNQINVAPLNSGVYIVKITEAGKTATRKLVVK